MAKGHWTGVFTEKDGSITKDIIGLTNRYFWGITKSQRQGIKILSEEVLDEDTIDSLKDSFDNVKIKAAMPTNIRKKRLSGYMYVWFVCFLFALHTNSI